MPTLRGHAALDLTVLATLAAVPLGAQSIAPAFSGSYTAFTLGAAAGVPGNYGGLTFMAGNANQLLIGGLSDDPNGGIYQIGVTRGAGNHVTGFTGAASLFASAPSIDGGLSFGPGNVLFYPSYPSSTVGEIKPGSGAADVLVDVSGIVPSSPGGLGVVPAGYAGAGQLALLAYPNPFAGWRRTTLTPDGSGTYTLSASGPLVPFPSNIGGEGFGWVPLGSSLFPVPSILVSEFRMDDVAAYQLDANGDPIVASRTPFMTFAGAQGATVDPLTGDFLFSSWGGNQLVRVSGFASPVTAIPEPATAPLVCLGLAAVAMVTRRRSAFVRRDRLAQ